MTNSIYLTLYQILKGKLKETLYSWPDKGKIEQGETSPLLITKQSTYSENQVTYMSDKVSCPRYSSNDSTILMTGYSSVFIAFPIPTRTILQFHYIVSPAPNLLKIYADN